MGAGVELGENCELASHVVIGGPSTLGSDNKIYSFAVLGGDPQDVTYKNEPTRLEVGDRNQIREYVTITRWHGEGRRHYSRGKLIPSSWRTRMSATIA